ncbi:efflux RND transporter permease subunit [Leptospira sp. 'Mane']|uniref:efflux RND transporter permease subunit n=1 Tax=Leptospira sp. 'Mane' TaxID=3387407 RepID=UPI00398B7073
MIEAIQRFILKRKVATSMFYGGFLIFGALSLRDIPISLLPNIEFPRLSIITTYSNASPAEMENLITKPISEIVGTIQGVVKVESESIEGYSFVHLSFKNGTDIHFSLVEVREKLDLIRDFLPQDASKPLISRFDPNKSSFMEVVFFVNGLSDDHSLRQFVEENLKVYLDRVDGVAAVQISGGHRKEVFIEIDPERMNSFRISPQDLRSLISINNKNYPAGQLPFGKKDLLVRAIGEYNSTIEVGNTIAFFNEGSGPVYISDFSNVKEQYLDRRGLARYNGKECIVAYIYKEPGKNSVQIAENVSNALSFIQTQFKKEVSLEVVYDESDFIKQSINNLFLSLIIGAVLAFLALLIILKNLQSPSLLLLAIPVTLFPSFLFFKFAGISFNMMSLGGLALGVGMLFDSSNVVLSAIERNLLLGKELTNAILDGGKEVATSILSATLTTIIVFLPITFLKSTLGIVFSEMALAIVVTLSMSLVVSLTFIPLAASFLYKTRKTLNSKKSKFQLYDEEKLIKGYHAFLKDIIANPNIYLLGMIALLVFSFTLIPFIQKEFLPKVDTGEFEMVVTLPRGTDLSTMSDFVSYLEGELLKDKQVARVVTNIGGEEENLKINPNAIVDPNKASLRVVLQEEKDIKTSDFISIFRKKLIIDPSYEISFNTRDNMLGDLLGRKKGNIEFLLIGNDLESIQEFGIKLKNRLLSKMSVLDVKLGMDTKNTEYHLKFNQVKMSRYGLTNAAVSTFVRIALKGLTSSSMKISGMETKIRIGMEEKYTDSLEKLKRLKIRTPSGENISLEQFVEIKEEKNLSSIMRRGNFRINPIQVTLDPKMIKAESEIKSMIQSWKLPEGIKLQFAGEDEDMDSSFKEVIFSFLLALLLIYMLLSAQFESYSSSFLMLFSVPLIFIGTFPALILGGKSLNISSFMGFILLMGVVVDNASLFFEYYRLFLEEKKDRLSAILASSEAVFKPVIMNNTTTILGMLPIVFELGKGSEFQAPLGVVVVSGLFTSTLLSLFVIPLLFYKFNKSKMLHHR